MNRQWTWGDAGLDTAKMMVHYFAKDTLFKNRLVSVSDQNCRDTAHLFVETYSVPKPNFNVNDTDQCLALQNFQMTNLSKIKQGTMGYQWLFGDGNSASSSNAKHISPKHWNR